jgi:hypothetical protein
MQKIKWVSFGTTLFNCNLHGEEKDEGEGDAEKIIPSTEKLTVP